MVRHLRSGVDNWRLKGRVISTATDILEINREGLDLLCGVLIMLEDFALKLVCYALKKFLVFLLAFFQTLNRLKRNRNCGNAKNKCQNTKENNQILPPYQVKKNMSPFHPDGQTVKNRRQSVNPPF